jgi:hypothetical protein
VKRQKQVSVDRAREEFLGIRGRAMLDTTLLRRLKPKPLEEIISRLNELVHRHCRKYLKRNLKPCPYNCKLAKWNGPRLICCEGRNSLDPEKCFRPEKFVPIFTKAELYEQFKSDLRDPETLVREYRDLAMLFWVIGADADVVEKK